MRQGNPVRLGIYILIVACTVLLPLSSLAKTAFGLQDGDNMGAYPGLKKAPEKKPMMVFSAPEQVLIGDAFLVRLTTDKPIEDMSVHWLGRTVEPSISVWNDKHVCLALLGTDVKYTKTGKHELVIIARVAGKDHTYKRSIEVQKKTFPRQDLTLPKNMVSPSPEALKRIHRERKVIVSAINTLSPQRMWTLPLLRPVPGAVSSIYGLRRFLNGQPRSPHRGVDFRGAAGSPIKATAAGKVVMVGDFYFSGKSVYIDHGNGVVSAYFHQSKPIVKIGEKVKRGQIIGLVGSTGRSTGAHLHFSLYVLGKSVNPMPLFTETVSTLAD